MTEAKKKVIKRKIIEINEEKCTGCGQCVIACAEGALAIIDGKARVVNDVFCDGLGACIGECPEGALEIIEREAPDFDEEAVEKYLESTSKTKKIPEDKSINQGHVCNCPSSAPIVYDQPYEEIDGSDQILSALRQWPTKLSLVNPNAPYFNNQELLIISDCSPVAFGDFHRKIMKGKPLVTVCPMLGLGELELNKLEEILKSNPIEHAEVILMEVPCCQKLKIFLDPIIGKIDRDISIEEKIISREGKIIN
ncbi:MAG: 4Fe-4S binding protein [Candidatus Lokiarchaeota archaeon]|nr:4Fe-4S binding protein [Candidatus Lokiarchaeota archaeon]